MAGKLSFSIAVNLITENFKRGANSVNSAFKQMKSSVLGFAAALGIGGAGLRNYIETVGNFEASLSKLSAILGTVPGKIKDLTDNAKKLGETTKYTAAEATNLQIELAKLGFSRDEILATTETVLKFAQATDSGLAEAAALAGASLRMFGAEATESERYLSAMAISTTKSALSFSYLQAALPTVGPVAKAFNFTIEDTLALLGKLADAGFDASSAATATRNILLNLADSGGALAKALGGSVKTLPELVSGLQRLKAQGVDLNTTLELTDKRSVAAFNAFLGSAGSIDTLRESITGVGEDLNRMATTMNDNVKGSLAGLGSAWEAIMIKLSESTNAPFKSVIDWLTGVLRSLKGNFSGFVAFVISLFTGRLLMSVLSFFKKVDSVQASTIQKAKVAETQKELFTKKRIEAEKLYESTKTAYETVENGKRLASKAQVSQAKRVLDKAELAERKATLAYQTAAEQAAAVRTATIWGRAFNTIKLAAVKLGMTLKALWATVWPMALIAVISTIIGKLVSMHEEAKRIKNIFSDYQKELSALGNTSEIAQLRVLQKLYNEAAGNKKLQEQYQKRIESIVGEQIKKEQNINNVIAKRIKLLEATATADFLTQRKVETEDKNRQLGFSSGIGESNIKHLAGIKEVSQGEYWKRIKEITGNSYSRNNEIDKIVDEYSQNLKILGDVNKRIENAVDYVVKNNTDKGINGGNGNGKGLGLGKDKSELAKLKESYAEELSKLKGQLEIGDISQAEYNNALQELAVKMYLQAASSSDREIAESEYLKSLKAAAETAIKDRKKGKALIELERVQNEYNSEVKAAQALFNRGFITQKELNEKLQSLSVEAAKSAAGISGIGDAADVFIATMRFNAGTLVSPVRIKPRDTTFDYKKSEVDIAKESLDLANEYAEKLKEEARMAGKALDEELAKAMARIPSLEEALKIAQVRHDIKELGKELNGATYSGIKDIASSSDRMVKAFQSLRDVMNDADASEWEKIMALWNAMTNIVDSFLSITKMIENITELTNKLAKAKESEAAIDTATTGTKIANKASETTSEITALGAQTTAEVAASTTKSTAASVEMAAKSTAAYAAIPFAGVSLAASQIAAMQAMIAAAAIPKFETGGIFTGGTLTGDKGLARLNRGEMILNMSQQSKLFDAINSGKFGGGNAGSISIGFDRVRGEDIYLSLKNYIKRTGKRL